MSPRDSIKSMACCSICICLYVFLCVQSWTKSKCGTVPFSQNACSADRMDSRALGALRLASKRNSGPQCSRVKIALLDCGKNPGLKRTALNMHLSLVFSAPLGLLHPRPTASGSCSGTVSPRAARRVPVVAEILLPPGTTTVTATQQNLEYPKREGKGEELAVFYQVTKYLLQ